MATRPIQANVAWILHGHTYGPDEIMTIDDDDGGCHIRKYEFWCSRFLFRVCALSWMMIRSRASPPSSPGSRPASMFLRKKQLKRILILYRFKSNKHHICSSICSLIRLSFFCSFFPFLLNIFFLYIFRFLYSLFGFAEMLCFGCDTHIYIWVRARARQRPIPVALWSCGVREWTTNYTCVQENTKWYLIMIINSFVDTQNYTFSTHTTRRIHSHTSINRRNCMPNGFESVHLLLLISLRLSPSISLIFFDCSTVGTFRWGRWSRRKEKEKPKNNNNSTSAAAAEEKTGRYSVSDK